MTKQAKRPIRRKSVSLQDVAEISGVSIATVSRILTGRTKSVPKTANAVRKAAAKLGYVVPSANVGSRKDLPLGCKHGQAALLVPDFRAEAASTAFTLGLLRGGSEACRRQDVNLDLVHTNEDGSYPGQTAIDGLVLKNWPNDERVLAGLPKLPTVLCMDSPMLDLPYDHIQFDLDLLAEKVSQHLQSRGSKRIAVATDMGQLTQRHTAERVIGAAQSAGIEAFAITPPPGELGIVDTIHQLLDLDPLPETVITYGSDAMVLALQMTCSERGIKVGEDLEIIPVVVADTRPAGAPCRHVVELPATEMGEAAADLLFWRLANPDAPPRRILLAPRLASLLED